MASAIKSSAIVITRNYKSHGIENSQFLSYTMESNVRARNRQSNNHGRVKYADIKNLYKSEWKAVANKNLFKGNVEVSIENYYNQDIDSPVKLILDSLTGSIIVDDRQVTKLTVHNFPEKRNFIKITVDLVGSVRDVMRDRIRNEGELFS